MGFDLCAGGQEARRELGPTELVAYVLWRSSSKKQAYVGMIKAWISPRLVMRIGNKMVIF